MLQHLRAGGGGVAILPTAPEAMRNRDSDYPYRHDSYFYYLTGFTEPESVLVLVAGQGAEADRSILFCRPKHEEREIWDGFRYGPEGARATFGFDEAHSVEEIDAALPGLLANRAQLAFPLAASTRTDMQVRRWLDAVRMQARAGVTAPSVAVDIRTLLDEMRLIKDAGELATMRRAGEISAGAHVRAMQATRHGLREYHLEAELLYEFRRHGAQSVAYNSIVAAGPNACVLHYRAGPAELRDGDLCLIDAGCEFDGYASDITRTFPVSGRFSPAQRELYDLVLAAQDAAIAERAWAWPTTCRTMPPCACSRRACSTPACSTATRKARSTTCLPAAAIAASTCTAPATGLAWTCMTWASTARPRRQRTANARGGRWSRAWS